MIIHPSINQSDEVIEAATAATRPGATFTVASWTTASSGSAVRVSHAVFSNRSIFRNACFRSTETPRTNKDVTLSRVAVAVGVTMALETYERLAFLIVIDVAEQS